MDQPSCSRANGITILRDTERNDFIQWVIGEVSMTYRDFLHADENSSNIFIIFIFLRRIIYMFLTEFWWLLI